MSSLADLPEIVGFFSYSREDDEAFKGTLSALRNAIQRELSAQLGRSKKTFRLWQDQVAIARGKLWEPEIKKAVDESVFFIPIVTPRAVNSKYCHFEFEMFLARERALDRTDLIFPILYIAVPALDNEEQWRNHPVLSVIGHRQYVDWRQFRHHNVQTPVVSEAIEHFCSEIVDALRQLWLSPEERRRQEEVEAHERAAEEERRREEAEARRQAEVERRRREAEAKRRAEEEDERRKRAEVEKSSAKRNADLGWLYESGQGVPQDYAKARECYQKAAAKDNVDAMFRLGDLYYSGCGVAQDYDKAREWYEKAADRDRPDAMFKLGVLYASGQGVAQDYDKKRECYEKAATKGDADAMKNLG